ncbi:MAG: 30S ribosomal protein S12 methylthiotransferase RimO [Deltaproteobacteria bacterium]|nr:30S ribosomal protein S12 methylthiotransferase RimO [Deltaproteobacteria bacterium]
MPPTVYIESLGCAKNQVDTEVMLGCLEKECFALHDDIDTAAIIIVNTCAFIEEATRESIDTILKYTALKRTGSCRCLIVCGCLPQRYKTEIARELPEVDLFLGSSEYGRIAEHIRALDRPASEPRVVIGKRAFLQAASTPRVISAPGSSAYLKIAEGCSHGCTYCAIPAIKGPYRQRSRTSIVQEARRLAAGGIQEINLVAQDTTRYSGLPELLRELCSVRGLEWVRLLYCHPAHLHTDIIRMMASEPILCRYIDMPLQHIADPVLKRMGRRETRRRIETLIDKARSICPEIALRTTFIVGFPGETEKDFNELLNFVRDVGFENLGAFCYRAEEGTPAAKIPGAIPEHVKLARYAALMSLQKKITRKKNAAMKGCRLRVLIDGISPREAYALQARTEFQAPEVDGVVFLNDDVPIGEFATVTVTRSLTYDLVGRVSG